jgi:hypothetical protein
MDAPKMCFFAKLHLKERPMEQIPLFWSVKSVLTTIDESLKMVCRYDKQLMSYSESRSYHQRKADVDALVDEINQYSVLFADTMTLEPLPDIRVLFGFWHRLQHWYDLLDQCPDDHYLVCFDEHNHYKSPLHFVLQPVLVPESNIPVHILSYQKIVQSGILGVGSEMRFL